MTPSLIKSPPIRGRNSHRDDFAPVPLPRVEVTDAGVLVSQELLVFGSLFAGIGGFDLGFERAGMKCAWQVEIDKWCNAVLARHWTGVYRASDVRESGEHNLSRVDIIVFGSPCQGLSVAGKQKGLNDKRSSIFHEAIRIIGELAPIIAVWENVPGVFSSNAGRDFAAVLGAFRECGARDIAWRIFNSRYFGVPQRRRRVFLVADFRGERAAEILFERDGSAGHFTPGKEAPANVANTLADGAGGRRYSMIPTVTALTGRDGRSPDDNTAQGGKIVAVSRDSIPKSDLRASNPPPASGPAYALRASQGGGDKAFVATPVGVRRLTPRECERLQSFPDDWTRHTPSGDEIADTHRYRMLGNAVTVNVAEWIGRRIVEVVNA